MKVDFKNVSVGSITKQQIEELIRQLILLSDRKISKITIIANEKLNPVIELYFTEGTKDGD